MPPDFNSAPQQFYDLNSAAPQGEERRERQDRGRYVKTDAVKAAVQGREADVVRALGIAWHGRDHIHCPYPDHPDRDPSWRLMETGSAVCTCRGPHSIFDVVSVMEGGDFESAKLRVAELLGRDDLIVDPNEPREDAGATIEQVAEAKQLPADFLRAAGWFDMAKRGKYHDKPPAIGIPYSDGNGGTWLHIRVAMVGKHKFIWKRGDKGAPLYGAHVAYTMTGRVFLVEGETDTITLWLNGMPALGLAGATNWNEARHASLLSAATEILVVIEPDTGGASMLKWLTHSEIRRRVKLVRMPDGIKDVNELWQHCNSDRAAFSEELRKCFEAGEPWSEENTAAMTKRLAAMLSNTAISERTCPTTDTFSFRPARRGPRQA